MCCPTDKLPLGSVCPGTCKEMNIVQIVAKTLVGATTKLPNFQVASKMGRRLAHAESDPILDRNSIDYLMSVPHWCEVRQKDDGGRNMRSCAVDAINTAQSLGLHRW